MKKETKTSETPRPPARKLKGTSEMTGEECEAEGKEALAVYLKKHGNKLPKVH